MYQKSVLTLVLVLIAGIAACGQSFTGFTSSSTMANGGASGSGSSSAAGGAGGTAVSSSSSSGGASSSSSSSSGASSSSSSSSSSSGATCAPAGPCEVESDCGQAPPCMVKTCAAGCCATSPAPASAKCDDEDPCTTEDHCDGVGACAAGTPVPVVYTYGGDLPNGQFPAGNAGGFCLYGATYCSTTGAKIIEAPAGYSVGTSVPADGCDANVQTGPTTWVQAFCKSCNGNCQAACP